MATKQQKPQAAYVDCQVLPGMFPGEFLAIFESLDPTDPAKRITVRVLVDKQNIEITGTPERKKAVTGRLKVLIVDRQKRYALAVLPQPGQPVGESVVVREDEIAVA